MKVSILMCVYNSNVDLFKEVINSIDNQTYDNFEVVIINDGSTDDELLNYLKYLNDKEKYVVYDNYKNEGLINSLNRGIKLCKGEYIARFDDDDISYCDRLKKQVEFLDSNPKTSVVSSYEDIMDEELSITTTREFPKSEEVKKIIPFRSPISHSLVMYRKQDIINVGMYEEEYRGCEDYALWLKMLKNGYRIDNIQQSLGKKKFTVADANKRNKVARKNLFRAKMKYLSKTDINGIIGLIFALIWANLHQSVINKIYSKDIKSSIMLKNTEQINN